MQIAAPGTDQLSPRSAKCVWSEQEGEEGRQNRKPAPT